MKDDEQVVAGTPAGRNAAAAAIDVRERSNTAYQKHQDFFDDPDHVDRVVAVQKVLEDFFTVKDIYINMRENRGKPFTVVKLTNQVFPRVSLSTKAREYRAPLEELGVEIVFSKGTNSYLYRVY